MNLGYSYRLVASLKARAATAETPVLALGVYCSTHGIPVASVAESLGVSRQTVYNWFWGKHAPSTEQEKEVSTLLARLQVRRVPT